MQRYEFVEGKTSKFWEVEVLGTDLTIRFGRIGSSGQSKTKNFGDAAAALRERDKLIREKTGKGYVEAGFQGTVSSPTAAGTATAASVGAANPVSVAGPPSVGDAIPWPGGGFKWKDEWRQALPPIRGIHAPPVDSEPGLLSKIPIFPENLHWNDKSLERMAAATARPWTFWSTAAARERVTPEALDKPDFDYWFELLAQAGCRNSAEPILWANRACIVLHGLQFTLEVVVAVASTAWETLPEWAQRPFEGMLAHLRQAIASAEEDHYLAALETAKGLRQRNRGSSRACAYLFPAIAEWTAEYLEESMEDPGQLLAACVMPAELFLRYLRAKTVVTVDKNLLSALCLQLHLHGEAALGALELAISSNFGDCGQAIDIATHMGSPVFLPMLAKRLAWRQVRDALEKVAKTYPAAVLKTTLEHQVLGRDEAVDAWILRLAATYPDQLSGVMAALDDRNRQRFEAALEPLQGEAVPPEALPSVLREPPWLKKDRPPELPTIDTEVIATEEVFVWDESLLQQARGFRVSSYWRDKRFPEDFGITPAGAERLLQGQWLQPGDIDRAPFVVVDMVFLVPEPVRLALWNSYPAERFGGWASNIVTMGAILYRYRFDAIPGLLAYMKAYPDKAAPLAEMVDSPALADYAVQTMRGAKKQQEPARRWLRKFPRTALFRALPQAFHSEPGSVRDNARHAIRWLADQGYADLAREAAQAYGAPMLAALEALLAADPLFILPKAIPKLPAFFIAAALHRPELTTGGSLPVVALEHIGTMLAISQIDSPYAGLGTIKEICTSTSLADFAWDVFQAWLSAGAPKKEAWAFNALGLLGDDQTARRLVPLIRAWPDQSVPARALAGLDILAAIGSDAALIYLNGLATRCKHKPVQKRAAHLIAAVAEARGLGTEELADRLVPDLGLDEAGALEFNFGPRRFFLRFDETLEPQVRDAQGTRLKAFPRPQKTDDPSLAAAASEQFKRIRAEARATASLQIKRLEQAMVARRRWSAADFRQFFLEQPLMRYLSARLVWGVYAEDRLMHGFRIAEDWTLADADDKQYDLPADASIGIPHPLEMPVELADAYTRIFADYEIAQPFRQLGREIYTLTAEELQSSTLTRFKDKAVYIGSVLSLNHRGWNSGGAVDGYLLMSYERQCGDDLVVEVQLDPGSPISDPTSEPKQRLPAVNLFQRDIAGQNLPVLFSRLDPIIASEMLRDLELLAPAM